MDVQTWALISTLLNPQLAKPTDVDICAASGNVTLSAPYSAAQIITNSQPDITYTHPDAFMVWWAPTGVCDGNSPPGLLVIFGPLGGTMPPGIAATLATAPTIYSEWAPCSWEYQGIPHTLQTSVHPLGGGDITGDICEPPSAE